MSRVLRSRRRGGVRLRWRGYTAKVAAGPVLAGMVLAGMAAGCSSAPAVPPGSVTSCTQFAAQAIRRQVTVATVPAACRGLTQVEVNVAVGRALRAAADGARGKVRQRELIARDSQYLAGLIHAVPASGPPVAASSSAPPSRAALNLAALVAWLVTVGLGASMMARWITRVRRHGGQRGKGRGPVLNFTHLGLALTGLLVWICYLITGVTGLAWAACGLLILVAALGMTLVFPVLVRDPASAPATALAGSAPSRARSETSPVQSALPPGQPEPSAARRLPVLIVAAHITAACITILLAILAAIGLPAFGRRHGTLVACGSV